MAATATALGSLSVRITPITLSATSVETVAHGLPTVPELVNVVVGGSATNTSLAGTISVTTIDATNLVFKNTGGQTISGQCTALHIHTGIR